MMNYIRNFVSIIGKIMGLTLRQHIALLLALVVSAAAIFLLVLSYGTSSHQPLYTNLSREDIGSISRILSEKGYDYETEHGVVAVAPSDLHPARLLLAKRGLPSGANNGLPIFDKRSAIGMSSLVSEADAKRIAKGEIERNLNALKQIQSSRVYISLSRQQTNDSDVVLPPSASVILKYDGRLDLLTINAIRNLVAGAVPGLISEEVTLVGANGVLISKKNAFTPVSSKLAELEREFSSDAEQKISAALGAYLGFDNLRISVSAKLNQDEREIDEVKFDPNSRVERSVQIVREADTISNSASDAANLEAGLPPENEETASAGNSSTEDKERREELTNYEINQRKVLVSSKGYRVEKVTAAVVVNDTRIKALLGDSVNQTRIDATLEEISEIVKVALNFNEDRGDVINVSAMEFYPNNSGEELGAGRGFGDVLSMHFGNLVTSISLIIGTVLFTVLAIGPIVGYLKKQSEAAEMPEPLPEKQGDVGLAADELDELDFYNLEPIWAAAEAWKTGESTLEIAMNEMLNEEERAKEVLKQLVINDEQRAIAALQTWLNPQQAGRV